MTTETPDPRILAEFCCDAPVAPRHVVFGPTASTATAAYQCPCCSRLWLASWMRVDTGDGREREAVR